MRVEAALRLAEAGMPALRVMNSPPFGAGWSMWQKKSQKSLVISATCVSSSVLEVMSL
jgi:hypothetical protein